jgi:transmembrane sensor
MDKNSLANYGIEDFVADESFINYHFRSNEKDNIFWDQWLLKNPSKKLLAVEAGKIIQSLSLTLSEKEYQEEYDKIRDAINKKKAPQLFRVLNWDNIFKPDHRKKRSLLYIIPALVIISAALAYMLFQHSENNIQPLSKTVNRSEKPMIFTLSDSTVITLTPNSSLQYPSSFQGENRQVYLDGEANFNVKRNEEMPFKVHTKNIVTTVLGTIFNIKKRGDSAIVVELLKGKLKVEIEDSTNNLHAILLYPNEKATYVFNDKHFYKNSKVIESDVSFHKNSFEEIAARIKNVFDITVINQSDQKNWRFTGEFKNTTPKEIVENICLIKNLKSREVGDTIFISN